MEIESQEELRSFLQATVYIFKDSKLLVTVVSFAEQL